MNRLGEIEMALSKKKVEKKNKADRLIEEQEKNNMQTNSAEHTIEQLNNIAETREEVSINKIEEKQEKNLGGRPKLDENEKRKKYTLTLKKDVYDVFKECARKEGLSFSVFVERAVNEYIKKDKNM